MKEIFEENGGPPNKVTFHKLYFALHKNGFFGRTLQINSDAGTEFINANFANLVKENRITHYVTNSNQKGFPKSMQK